MRRPDPTAHARFTQSPNAEVEPFRLTILLNMNDYVALGGHLFGDTSNGIDHERCRLCGLYRHHFDRNPVDCVLKSRANQDQPSPESPQDEDFGDSWAIRPQLDYSEIYSGQPCLDVYRFPSRERLLAYLDEDILPHTENGASIDTADATFCCWPPFCDWPRLTRREQRWWGRIPVRSLAYFDAPAYAGPTFTEFLERNGGLAVWPSEEVEASVERFLDGREPSVECCLASEWRIEEVTRDTELMPGHEFAGRALKSLAHQIAMVVDDLQAALRRRHSNISVSAEAAFLQSWEVLRHIAEFCGKRLARSAEATAFIQTIKPQSTHVNRYVENARRAIHLQLPVYVDSLRRWTTSASVEIIPRAPKTPAPDPQLQRGFYPQNPAHKQPVLMDVSSERPERSPTEYQPIPQSGSTRGASSPANVANGPAGQNPERLLEGKEWVTLQTAALYLERSADHLRRLARTGKVTRMGRGRPLKISTTSLRKYKLESD